MMQTDLFECLPAVETEVIELNEGAFLWKKALLGNTKKLLQDILLIEKQSPFRKMMTPGGYFMSVEMTNCGQRGWVSDKKGYRYDRRDPLKSEPWPTIPPFWYQESVLWAKKSGFDAQYSPDACLINRYAAKSKLSLHQDKDEVLFGAPIVSFSLMLS